MCFCRQYRHHIHRVPLLLLSLLLLFLHSQTFYLYLIKLHYFSSRFLMFILYIITVIALVAKHIFSYAKQEMQSKYFQICDFFFVRLVVCLFCNDLFDVRCISTRYSYAPLLMSSFIVLFTFLAIVQLACGSNV